MGIAEGAAGEPPDELPYAPFGKPSWELSYEPESSRVPPPRCDCVGTYACAVLGRRPSAASASICSTSSGLGRCAGSLRSRAVMTGSSGPAFSGSPASSSTTACMVVSGEVRRNGERPSTAVYSVAPSAHRSEDGPGSCPRTRSGAR